MSYSENLFYKIIKNKGVLCISSNEQKYLVLYDYITSWIIYDFEYFWIYYKILKLIQMDIYVIYKWI